MASVAAAIEEASVHKADGGLWWESHVSFFETLDKTIAADDAAALLSASEKEETAAAGEERKERRRGVSLVQESIDREAELVAEKVSANHEWLLKTLAQFKRPSATSRAALDSSKVAVGGGGHILKITSNLKELAIKVSALLELDEIQSYILASRVTESKSVSFASLTDDAILSAVLMTYYMERQSLLKATRLLLTCEMAEQGNTTGKLSQALSDEVVRLVEDGLQEKIQNVLKDSLSSVQPKHLDREYADLWAEETALEQTLLLDIIFLLYYQPLCLCNFTNLQDLMNIFEDLIIWRSRGEILALTPETEKSLRHARRQAVLIIIEALDLESLLLTVHKDIPFSESGHSLSMDDLRKLDVRMTRLDLERAAECGPVLLSWATFLCLVSFLPLPDGQATVDADHTLYMRQAYEAGSYKFLLDMLRDDYFQEFDNQLGGGYKSVIKTLMSAFLAAYDSTGLVGSDGHDATVDVLCEIYRGQEALCLEFWDRDSFIDGPIRNLLFSLRDSFPYQTLSLVRLLATQCEGIWPAECVYDFLYTMVEITCLYQIDERSLLNESGSMVQTTIALQVPDAPGLLIPAGTSGRVLRELSGGVRLVRWECKHSGMVVLLLRMLQRSIKSYQTEEVFAIVDLINCMLSSNKTLTQFLLDLDVSPATATARAGGRMESSLRLDTVSMICSVINASVLNIGDNATIASCIGILTSCSFCCAEHVISKLGQSLLFQPSGSYLSSSDGRAVPGSQLHELIVKAEQSSGRYPVTIALLDFTRTMAEIGNWGPTESSSFTLESLVMHVIGNVFVNHGNWKYQQWCDRWIITTKVIGIMQSIVTGIARTREVVPSLKGVMELLLYDCAVQDVLISVLSISALELEELHFNRSVGIKEVEWLHQAIYSVLMLLHDLVVDVTVGVCSKEYNGVTLLEQTLFRKATGSLPVVTAIMSFLSFSRDGDLQLASAKALSSLLLLGQRSRQHPNSIASFISSTERKRVMQTAIGELLSVETAFSNCPLFEATIDLLTSAVRCQPALVEHLLLPIDKPTGALTATSTSEQGVGVSGRPDGKMSSNPAWATEGLDALCYLITNSPMLFKSHPRVLSRVLFLLASIWEGGIEYLHIIEALRSRSQFWKELTSCLSFSSNSSSKSSPTLLSQIKAALDPDKPAVSSLSNNELVAYAFMYTCEASVLSIMARDIFLQQHLIQIETKNTGRSVPGRGATENGSGKTGETTKASTKVMHASPESGALPIVLEWCKKSHLTSITSSYTNCLYNREAVFRAKAEARVLLVGLMGKILSGDTRGLNVSLARRIRETATQIGQHPAFEELSEQYSSSGYSYGEQLEIMLISDLFHHLQGELDGGRPIPSGPFEHVAKFLVSSGVDCILNPTASNQLTDIHPSYGDTFMFDTAALETGLGLEWWEHADFGIVTASVAENTLKWAQHSNAMASLGHSQLSALRSWSGLLTVSLFNKREADGVAASSAVDWTEAKLTNYSTELCMALEGMLTTIGPIDDATNFTPSFLASQGHVLLVLTRWLSNLGTSSSEMLRTSANLIGTVVGCVQKLLGTQSFQHQQIKELVKSFLGSLLLLLELVHSKKGQVDEYRSSGQPSDKDVEDTIADVTLVGLGFLPSLCTAVEKFELANIGIAVINVLTKSFLAPSTWFPVLQNLFPWAQCLARMQEDPRGPDSKVILNFCFSFVRFKGGAELLHSAGFFSQLQSSNYQENEMGYPSGDPEGPFFVWGKRGRQQNGDLWSVGIAVVAGLLRSLGDKDPTGRVVENAFTYLQTQQERMAGALRAPSSSMDVQGRKKAKVLLPGTTLSALRETQHVIGLMCEVSRHPVPWTLEDPTSGFGELVVHLLAFIAREGRFGGTGLGFNCQPLQRDEIAAHTRPAMINSNYAWFAITARGSSSRENVSSVRSQSPSRSPSQSLTFSPSRRASSLSSLGNSPVYGGAGGVRASEYSNMVAIHIYKLSFLLLRYMCQRVHQATRRVEEGAPPDYNQFPELPAPEILHDLQDQVIPLVTDICRKEPDESVREVCPLLLLILEMTLYLEVCIAKTCNVGPLPLRSDDFVKEYKAMTVVGSPHSFLEPLFQSLTAVMSSAHPGQL